MENPNKKTYKSVKNYIHNELGFSNEYIREVIKNSVEKQIRLYIEDTFNASSLDLYIKDAINKKVEDTLNSYDFSSRLRELILNKIKLDLN